MFRRRPSPPAFRRAREPQVSCGPLSSSSNPRSGVGHRPDRDLTRFVALTQPDPIAARQYPCERVRQLLLQLRHDVVVLAGPGTPVVGVRLAGCHGGQNDRSPWPRAR